MNFVMICQFLPERMKIDIRDKIGYLIHRNLKQALNHGLALKKVHRVIRFYQNICLKPYIDINTDLRKKAKNDLEKIFF